MNDSRPELHYQVGLFPRLLTCPGRRRGKSWCCDAAVGPCLVEEGGHLPQDQNVQFCQLCAKHNVQYRAKRAVCNCRLPPAVSREACYINGSHTFFFCWCRSGQHPRALRSRSASLTSRCGQTSKPWLIQPALTCQVAQMPNGDSCGALGRGHPRRISR